MESARFRLSESECETSWNQTEFYLCHFPVSFPNFWDSPILKVKLELNDVQVRLVRAFLLFSRFFLSATFWQRLCCFLTSTAPGVYTHTFPVSIIFRLVTPAHEASRNHPFRNKFCASLIYKAFELKTNSQDNFAEELE